jgi:PIN domain nuclease of toxin-antitoxin system
MLLLLDTNALIWWLKDPSLLSGQARIAIETPTNTVLCSAVSSVEIAIKTSNGKLSLQSDWEAAAHDAQFTFLPLTFDHARCLRTLPMLHKDPFDRMLVAQTIIENATFVTSDTKLADYGIPVLAT